MNNCIIALDLSTTVCGYTIFKNEKLEWGFYKFKQVELIDRGIELLKFLHNMIDEHKFDTLIIEANLKSFQAGGTSASAMLNTSKMNFFCQVYSKEVLKINVVEYNVIRARNLWKPGFTKMSRVNKTMKDKELVFKLVLEEVKCIGMVVDTKIISRGKNKGEIRYIDEGMDMTDSYVLMKAHLNSI